MKNKQKAGWILAAALLLMFLTAMPALAWDQRSADQTITIGSGEVIQDDMALAAQRVVVNGTVYGDLAVSAQDFELNGTVTGDLILFSQNVVINGQVDNNLRSMSQKLQINGTIGRNALLFCQSVDTVPGSKIAGSFTGWIQTMTLNGPIGKNVTLGSEKFVLNAPVGGNVKAGCSRLTLGTNARVQGDLSYTSSQRAAVDPGAVIAGKTIYQKPVPDQQPPHPKETSLAGKVVQMLIGVLMLLVLWGLWYYLSPASLAAVQREIQQKPGGSLAWGIFLAVVSPVALLLIFITIVGIPLAVIGVMFLTALTLAASMLVGSQLGKSLVEVFPETLKIEHPALIALFGIFLLSLLKLIPFVGGLITIVVVLLAFGSVLLAVQRSLTERNGAEPPQPE